MSQPSLLRQRDGDVLTLVLNRPEKLNAIDAAMAGQLLDCLTASTADPTVRVVRLRGSGRAFCAGRDVSQPPTDEDLHLVQAVSRAIVTHPRPVVAAVHGWVVGAGLEWMMTADLVYAAQGARFRLPEAQLGVFVTGGVVATLPAAVGLNRARSIMLLGDTFGAAEAVAWGIAAASPPEAELDAVSRDACTRLAALRPEVAAQFKRVLNQVGLAGYDAALGEETRAQRHLGAG